MRITQLIAYSRIISIYKKGKFISPFYIFISLLISISYTQFLPSNWSHPNISSINGPINGYATFQTIDDITYISDNDSTKIYNITNQFFSELNISKDLTLDIELMQRINKFKASYDLLLIDIKQKSKNINSKLKYHKLKKLTPSLLININNHALLLGGNLKFDFSQDIQIEVEKKSTEQLISTHLFYDDYQFILNNRKRRGEIITLQISYQSKNILFNFLNKKSSFKINENINDKNRLSNPFHNDDISKIISEYKLKNNFTLFTYIDKKKKNFSLYFIDNNDAVMKLNEALLNSQKISMGYRLDIDQNYFKMGFSNKTIDLLVNTRFKTRIFSSELEAYFGAPIVNNISTAKVNVKTIFINYKKILPKHILNFYIEYLIDYYDINIESKLYPVLPIFPLGTLYNTINYNKKIGLVLGIEESFKINNVNCTIKFYQHIPVKFYKGEETSMPQESSSGYGFGKILINLSIPIR